MKEKHFSYSTRIGKTNFIVNVKQSESAKKPLDTKLNPEGEKYRKKIVRYILEVEGRAFGRLSEDDRIACFYS